LGKQKRPLDKEHPLEPFCPEKAYQYLVFRVLSHPNLSIIPALLLAHLGAIEKPRSREIGRGWGKIFLFFDTVLVHDPEKKQSRNAGGKNRTFSTTFEPD